MWLTLTTLTLLFQLVQIRAQNFALNVPKNMPLGPLTDLSPRPSAVYCDISGSAFYLGGYTRAEIETQHLISGGDAFLSKRFFNGTPGWSRIVGGNQGSTAYSIVQNPSTLDVFLMGYTISSVAGIETMAGKTGGLLAKFASNGSKIFTSSVGNDVSFRKASVDVQNLQISMVGACGTKICLITCDINNGSTLRQMVFPANGYGYGITTESNSKVSYMVGTFSEPFDEQPFYGVQDIFLSKVDTLNGSRYWTAVWGTSKTDNGLSVQFDRASQLVFIAGTTLGSINGHKGVDGSWNSLLICAHANGTRLWTTQYYTAENEQSYSLSIHRPTGALFVTGQSYGPKGTVLAFSNNGTLFQSAISQTTSQYNDICFDPTWTKAYIADVLNQFATLQISGDYSGYSDSPPAAATRTPLSASALPSASATQLSSTALVVVSASPLLVSTLTSTSTPLVSTSLASIPATTLSSSALVSVSETPLLSSTVLSASLPLTSSASTADQTIQSTPVQTSSADTPQSTFLYSLTGSNSIVLPLVAAVQALLIILLLFCVVLRRKPSHGKSGAIRENGRSETIGGPAASEETSMRATQVQAPSTISTLVRGNFELSLPGFLEVKNGLEFRIQNQIAKGGGGSVFMGTAFSGQLTRFGTALIVKTVGEGAGTLLNKLTVRQTGCFYQEVSIMHYFRDEKHIAKLLGWSDAPACMLIKFYSFGSLDKWVRKGSHVQVTKSIALHFVEDISRGVMAMHTAGFVHCDLKPQNVLVDTDDNGQFYCVLTDFGITQIVDDSSLLVREFAVVNLRGFSIQYAAPEVFQRFRSRPSGTVPGEVVMKVDIYSLAVIMLELLKRKSPW